LRFVQIDSGAKLVRCEPSRRRTLLVNRNSAIGRNAQIVGAKQTHLLVTQSRRQEMRSFDLDLALHRVVLQIAFQAVSFPRAVTSLIS
jgi:hypothetical protein